MNKIPSGWPIRLYVAATAAVALAFLGLTAATTDTFGSGRVEWVVVPIFWIAYGLAFWPTHEVFVLGQPTAQGQTKKPSLSVGFLVLMTAAFSLPPLLAAVVGGLSPFVPGNRRGLQRAIFNASQGVLYTGAASAIYASTGAGGNGFRAFISCVIAGLAAVTINTLLVAAAVAIDVGSRFRSALKQLLWPARYSVVLVLTAFFVSTLIDAKRPYTLLALVFLIGPLVLLRHVRRGKLELDRVHHETLRSFVQMVELKDPYTRYHSERVAAIVVEMHRALDRDEQYVTQRFYGALLHDIGKIDIPPAILSKPGKLTEEEYNVVKAHPRVGAAAVREVAFLASTIDEILHHHERLDGLGYPDGLSEKEISVESRTLAVADTFEALTSDRPYRPALTDPEALDEMRRVAGTQLDSKYVELLANLLSSGVKFPRMLSSFSKHSAESHVGTQEVAN